MLLFLGLLIGTAAAEPRFELSGGVGLPELVHLEAGVGISPRWTVEARAASTVLNPELGAGVSGYLLGTATETPPKNALVVHGSMLINPSLRPLTLQSGGDRLAAYVNLGIGYAWHSDSGFFFRALTGPLLYDDGGFAVGPNITVGVGVWFP